MRSEVVYYELFYLWSHFTVIRPRPGHGHVHYSKFKSQDQMKHFVH